ncbi:hypothetical protein ACFVFS_22075 [Kitasatospora sp. NPDC057692]|uniref:hypothetical protein n=1 Tax=Kitasatospora sp. NPDC057692 TaxID=3346215 RepID=UPI0036C5C474
MSVRSRLRGRRRLLTAAGSCLAIGLAVSGLLVLREPGDRDSRLAVAVNDVSGRATACLAADTATATGSGAVAAVWAAMQTAGRQHDTSVQQMITPVTGAEQAAPYLAGLVTQRCDMIVTVGTPFGQAGPTLASAVPSLRITAVDSALAGAPAGMILLNGPDAAAQVAEQVGALRPRVAAR